MLLHVLLLGSMVAFAIALFVTAFRAPTSGERLRRFLGIFVGAMIVLGAQAAGVSFAVFTAGALASGRAPSTVATLAASVVPAAAGAGLGFYMVRVYKKNENLGLRVLCFLGMLSLVAFIEVYAVATHTNGVFLGVAAVPNISFAAGVGLVLIFGSESKDGKSISNRARSGWRWLRSGRPKPNGTGATSGATAGPHDPFDI